MIIDSSLIEQINLFKNKPYLLDYLNTIIKQLDWSSDSSKSLDSFLSFIHQSNLPISNYIDEKLVFNAPQKNFIQQFLFNDRFHISKDIINVLSSNINSSNIKKHNITLSHYFSGFILSEKNFLSSSIDSFFSNTLIENNNDQLKKLKYYTDNHLSTYNSFDNLYLSIFNKPLSNKNIDFDQLKSFYFILQNTFDKSISLQDFNKNLVNLNLDPIPFPAKSNNSITFNIFNSLFNSLFKDQIMSLNKSKYDDTEKMNHNILYSIIKIISNNKPLLTEILDNINLKSLYNNEKNINEYQKYNIFLSYLIINSLENITELNSPTSSILNYNLNFEENLNLIFKQKYDFVFNKANFIFNHPTIEEFFKIKKKELNDINKLIDIRHKNNDMLNLTQLIYKFNNFSIDYQDHDYHDLLSSISYCNETESLKLKDVPNDKSVEDKLSNLLIKKMENLNIFNSAKNYANVSLNFNNLIHINNNIPSYVFDFFFNSSLKNNYNKDLSNIIIKSYSNNKEIFLKTQNNITTVIQNELSINKTSLHHLAKINNIPEESIFYYINNTNIVFNKHFNKPNLHLNFDFFIDSKQVVSNKLLPIDLNLIKSIKFRSNEQIHEKSKLLIESDFNNFTSKTSIKPKFKI